jgi:hypothetical protein
MAASSVVPVGDVSRRVVVRGCGGVERKGLDYRLEVARDVGCRDGSGRDVFTRDAPAL